MSAKVGDTVRFLNSVGGGRVMRIADGIAYVDEDGFKTPVLLRECVVVASASEPTKVKSFDVAAAPSKERVAEPQAPAPIPVIETRNGDKLTIVLGFEPVNIKALSTSSFEAYLVNDSNYCLFMTVASKAKDDHEWKLRFDGIIEPNMQEFLFELEQSDLPATDRLQVQYVAFKLHKDFESKRTGDISLRFDATKFARLHCFRQNPYFESPVIAFDIALGDDPPEPTPDLSVLVSEKPAPKHADVTKLPQKTQRPYAGAPIVVDLHASELIDDLSGLSNADILNMQIDRFQQEMDRYLRHPGTKIVFIHGKGEGVLRQALMKELSHRYKGHDVQDASFREYGFGATQVTIRQHGAPQNNRRRR